MKYLLILLSIYCSFNLVGQQEVHHIDLQWQTDDQARAKFDGAIFSERNPNMPVYVFSLPIGSDQRIEATLSNVLTDRPDLTTNEDLPLNFEINVWTETNRQQKVGFVAVSTLRNGMNGPERLLNADLIITSKTSGENRLRGGGNKTESVLKEGDIYKLSISTSGVQEISGTFLRDELGITLSDVDVTKLNVYGNSGGRLPESNSADRTDDLEQLPVRSIGLDDGSFDVNDKILFYAEEAGQWKLEGSNWIYETNIYSDLNYVFLKLNGDATSAIPVIASSTSGERRANYIDRQYYGKDELNLLGRSVSHQGSGKIWMSDEISNSRRIDLSDQFDLNEVQANSNMNVLSHFYGRSESKTSYNLSIGAVQFDRNISGTDFDPESTYAKLGVIKEDFVVQGAPNGVVINYPNSASPSEGWLDFVNLNFRRQLTDSRSYFFVVDTFSNNEGGFSLNTMEQDWVVWDVSNVHEVSEIGLETQIGKVEFSHPNADQREFLFFRQSVRQHIPGFIEKIENQNLHELDNIDMVILTPSLFQNEAERLKQHRSDYNGYDIAVVDVAQVYNEFGSGRKDPTAIRDFAKMLLDRNPKFKFLCLFGDGSYDWRHTVSSHEDQDFIPAYETDESMSPIYAFPSDDYYTLLSDDEGEDLTGSMDIAVGRLLCKNEEEAKTLVDKIVRYESNPQTFGDWRNKLIYLADDEDSNRHVNDVDRIAVDIQNTYPVFNQDKIYFDAYEQVSTPGGNRYPEAKEAINTSVFKGGLVMVYLGHGGPTGLAQERVLQATDIRSWNNYFKMPVIMTATCSFTGFDEPGMTTAGEYSVLNDNGGAIAILSTVRAVYASDNFALTSNAHEFLYARDNGQPIPLGEVMRRAKNSTKSGADESNNRKFSLFGDPSMALAIPIHNVVTNTINGVPANEFKDTVGALQRITIKGAIADQSGQVMTQFNGIITPTVYDKAITLQTKANDSRSRVKDFNLRKNIIFKGSASVVNGEFEFTFVIPKDINFDIGEGKISYYATNNTNLDAAGYYDSIIIGGVGSGGVTDEEGPEVEVYMNTEDFVFGGITNPDPTLLLVLSDDNGINVVGNSIGHDLTAVLDDNTQNTLVLNDFYEAKVDDFTEGIVKYPLKDIAVGRHKVKVTAWDIANNFTEGYTEFVVVDDLSSSLDRVLNYPNPFTTSTQFQFEHNLPSGPMDITVQIYSVSGKLVKTIMHSTFSDGFRVDDIHWDGTDDFGSPIAKGVYLYKIRVQLDVSGTNLKKESEYEKLVILK